MPTSARLVAPILLLSACPQPLGTGATDGQPFPTTTTTTTTGPTTGSTSWTTSTTMAVPTTTAPETSSSTTSSVSTTAPVCPVGAEGCECTGGGSCDPGLVCDAGVCVAGCAIGGPGCPCTAGGGCDAGLTCDDGTCSEGVSPPCIPGVPMDDCCGDGVLDDFEECDLGVLDNADDGECTTTCKFAVCGDGLTLKSVEACDGEEYCADDCTFKTCGDGIVDPWEWCEKSRPDDPECTDMCMDARKVVFITSTHYQGGALGGLAGADAKCQAHAESAGFSGTFKAMLATSKLDPPEEIWPWAAVPHINSMGVEMFTPPDPEICNLFALVVDESGNPHTGCKDSYDGDSYWVWAVYDGAFTHSCESWSSLEGEGAAIKMKCSIVNNGASCSSSAPIVCVEQ